MIISVEKIKRLVKLDDWTDEKIRLKLDAIEQTIRAYTNNNFQVRTCRSAAFIEGGAFLCTTPALFRPGDTVQVSESDLNAGIYTVAIVDGPAFTVEECVQDEGPVLVTKVAYPADVEACAVNLMEWEVINRAKVGIQSETLSRHSVTYFSQDGANQVMGYPASLLGCLKAYRKARC